MRSVQGAENSPRLISLAPALTEILYAMGAADQIVGVSAFSDVPAEAKRKPSVGDYSRPNIEKILSLRPTLIFGLREGIDTYSGSLRQANAAVLLVDLRTLEDYPLAVLKIGAALGRQSEASALAKEWTSAWQRIPKSTASRRVLIQVDQSPLIVAGRGTFLHEIITRCGHVNVNGNREGYPQIQTEVLAARKPDLVLITVHGESSTQRSAENFWKNQKLFTKPRVILADPNEVSRLGPRLPAAAARLCSSLESVPI